MLTEQRAVVRAENESFCFFAHVIKITNETGTVPFHTFLLCSSLILDSLNVGRSTYEHFVKVTKQDLKQVK
jgi:hypothetical protein